MRRALPGIALATAALALGGCSLGGGDDGTAKKPGRRGDAGSPAPERSGPKPPAGEPKEARQIRGWSEAVADGDYMRAADYFAIGAIIEQGGEIKLESRVAAIAFNRSLPCKSKVTKVRREKDSVIGTFKLRAGDGPASVCQGTAEVRFRFEKDKFTEWRQLPGPAVPDGGQTA